MANDSSGADGFAFSNSSIGVGGADPSNSSIAPPPGIDPSVSSVDYGNGYFNPEAQPTSGGISDRSVSPCGEGTHTMPQQGTGERGEPDSATLGSAQEANDNPTNTSGNPEDRKLQEIQEGIKKSVHAIHVGSALSLIPLTALSLINPGLAGLAHVGLKAGELIVCNFAGYWTGENIIGDSYGDDIYDAIEPMAAGFGEIIVTGLGESIDLFLGPYPGYHHSHRFGPY